MSEQIAVSSVIKEQRESFSHKLFKWFYHKKLKSFDGIPGPVPAFPLGTAQEIMGKQPLWEVLGSYKQKYGGMSLIWIFSKPSLVLNDPKLIRQVLLTLEQQEKISGARSSRCPVTKAMDFYKDLPLKALKPMLTDTSAFEAKDQGAEWQNLSANNPFMLPYYDEWIDQQLEPLKNFIQERSQSLAKNKNSKLPAYETIQELTCQGFAFATIGRSLPSEMIDCFRTMCDAGTSRMGRSSLSKALIPKNPINPKYRRASRHWFKFFSQALSNLKAQPDQHSLMAWVLDRGETNFTLEDLRNYIAGVYPGGAVSSPSGTTSALYLLSKHPEFLPPLIDEIRDLFSAPITTERLESCVVLDQVLRETLRLKPPVPFFTRNVGPQGVKLGQFEIPGNTQIFIPNWQIHRDPNYWPDAKRFNPNRWDSDTCSANTYGCDHFFPFGRGNRACIGQLFAKTFMKLSLAVLIHEFQFEFGPEPDDPNFHFAVAVPDQLQVAFSNR